MLLCIDIGNTNIGICLLKGNKAIAKLICPTYDEAIESKMSAFAQWLPNGIRGGVISSVVEEKAVQMQILVLKLWRFAPYILSKNLKTNITLGIESAETLGMDRFITAHAAFTKYKKSVVVVDYGTANTYDYIDEKGMFSFGLICPGVGTSAAALHKKTSMLPRITVTTNPKFQARNTKDSILAGIYYSKLGETEYILKRMKEDTKTDPFIVATGGYAQVMAKESAMIDTVEENLIFEGMQSLYEMNFD